MEFTIDLYQLRQMLRDAAEHAVKQYRIETGQEKPFYSLRESYRLYGKSNVDRWIKVGLVCPRKSGQKNSKIRIDKIELDRTSKIINLNLV